MAAAKRARQLLDRHELDEVRDVSAGAATFYVFVSLISFLLKTRLIIIAGVTFIVVFSVIDLDKSRYSHNIFRILLHKKHMLWYSLEAPLRGVTHEYHKMFLWRNKDINIFRLKKVPYLELYLSLRLEIIS